MTPFPHGLGTLALGMVIAAATLLDRPALAAASKKCTALERRLDTKLRRGLKGCAKAVGLVGSLRCSGDKRDRHVATLAARGCPSPAWAVDVETVRVSKATVALEWTSRLNWARLLDRPDDPIASTRRRPGNRFENVLLLDPDSDLATIVDYVLDVEVRASDVEDGLPGTFVAPTGRRPTFPAVRDRSVGEALDTLGDVFIACEEGEPSMFANDGDDGRKIGGVSGEALKSPRDLTADNGNRGAAFARMFVDLLDAISDDDEEPEPEPEPEPADDEQCQENEDGKCNEGGENPDDGQSQPGGDDPQGTPAPADGQPAPSGTQTPSEDGQRCGGLETFTTVCDSIEWQSPTCRAFVRHVNGCADEALVNPGPEGDTTCSAEGEGSDAELRELECEQQGGIALPGPDGALVCRTADLELLPDVGNQFDPCNNPEAQATDEMCAQQGGAGIDLGGEAPTPAPDPRAR